MKHLMHMSCMWPIGPLVNDFNFTYKNERSEFFSETSRPILCWMAGLMDKILYTADTESWI